MPALRIALARISEPRLRGRPVAVALPAASRARVLSVSREATAHGVFKGMPLIRALKRCPDLAVLPPDAESVERASHRMAQIAAQYTPLWEMARPGHVYLDVTGTRRLWGAVTETAGSLRKAIEAALSLRGFVGVAGNKMVSDIASRTSDGILHVNPGGEAVFPAPLPVDRVPGIGRARRKLLAEALNIRRIGQLAGLDVDRLKLVFGSQAPVIHQRALGIDPTPVYPRLNTPVMSETVTFPEDENDDAVLLGALYRLVDRCAYRMRKRGLVPKKAGLLVRYADQVAVRRQVALPPGPWMASENGFGLCDGDLYGPLKTLFFKGCHRRVRVGTMRVWFWDFGVPEQQLSLFHSSSPERERSIRITRALDRIRDRYGEGVFGGFRG
ncbi:MAG: hypothetical protein U5R49_03000 [Deltaproteobacteria bacterium]|nr:hypothetical protein [Deltaproteobacteria bacterium]